MELIEKKPLPKVCKNCKDPDCWECDHAGERWQMSHIDELSAKKKGLQKAIERLQKQIDLIDEEIRKYK